MRKSEGGLQHRSKWGQVVKVRCVGVRSYSKKVKEKGTKTDLFAVGCASWANSGVFCLSNAGGWTKCPFSVSCSFKFS